MISVTTLSIESFLSGILNIFETISKQALICSFNSFLIIILTLSSKGISVLYLLIGFEKFLAKLESSDIFLFFNIFS